MFSVKMKNSIYLLAIFRSHYCQAVFSASLLGGYFLMPHGVFHRLVEMVLVFIFIILFALVLTCLVRNIKEKIVLAKTYTSSLISIVAAGIGLAALQVCGVNAPICGASVGLGFLSALFPSLLINFLEKYGLYLLAASISFQILSLYLMNCFKRVSLTINSENTQE